MFFEEVKVRIQLEMKMIEVREVVRNYHPLDVLLLDYLHILLKTSHSHLTNLADFSRAEGD
jgi:hypothetical protein